MDNASTNRQAAPTPMDMPPVTSVVDRKLDELCGCLEDALSSSKQRSPYAEERLRDAITSKIVFLRSLLVAEAECHGGALPEHLAEAKARFAVLEATFAKWARRAVVAAPEPVEEQSDCSGSTCSCTDSCHEAATDQGDTKRDVVVEARDTEGASDVIAEDNNDDAEEGETAETRKEVTVDAIGKKRDDTNREATAETGKRAVQHRWWRQSAAAWCGVAGVGAVVAVGLALELATVAHHNVNVYVVPT